MTLYILREKTMLLCINRNSSAETAESILLYQCTHKKEGCMLCVPWSTQSTVMATQMDRDTQPSADKEK